MKVKQLYDIGSIVAAAEVAKGFNFSDKKIQDSAGLLLPRQLEHISTTIYQQRFANLSLLTTGGITVNNEGGVAESITKLKRNIIGDFATSGNKTNTDGKISLETTSDTIPVYMKKASSSWSEIELEQAQLAGTNLVGDLIGAHNTRYNQQIDERGYVGDSSLGLEGLLNFSGFATTPATGTIDTLTPQQMYDNFAGLVIAQRAGVQNDEVFSADKVAVSPVVYNTLSETILNTAAGAMSVMRALEMNLNITFVITFRATALKVAVAYSSSDMAMVMRIPTTLRVSNIYQKGFDSYVESLFRVGGLDVIENGAGYILTGIEA